MTRPMWWMLEPMCRRVRPIALGMMLVGATAHAQSVTCNADSPVERVYVEVNVRSLLDSDQLWADFGVRNWVPLTKSARGVRWFIDLWRDDTPIPLKPEALGGLSLSPTKPGWWFTRRQEQSMRVEALEGRGRCTASLLFDAVRVWRVRVVAEPRGEANPVPIDCRSCGAGSKTDFITQWAPVGVAIPMTADFGRECKVELKITENDLPDKTFSVGSLYQSLNESCLGLFSIAARRPKIPKGGISVHQVPPP